MWYQFFKYSLFAPFVKVVVQPWMTGMENIPKHGGAIMAGNHLAAGDTFMFPSQIRRQVTFAAKAELFQGNRGLSSKIVAWFMRAVGQVPMDRHGGLASARAVGPIVEALRGGALSMIFPEGTRSPDGRLYKGKTGVARMALAAGVPVIPVGVVGTKPRRGPFGIPIVHKPGFIVGKPLDFSPWHGAHDQRTLRWITDEIMAAIQELTGQDYVDVYASRVKYGDLKGVDISDRVKERPGGGDPPPYPEPDPSDPETAERDEVERAVLEGDAIGHHAGEQEG